MRDEKACATMPAGRVNQEASRLSQGVQRLDSSIASLEALATRLYGPLPEDGCNSVAGDRRDVSSGALGELAIEVDNVFGRADRLARIVAVLSDVA